jgi:hypothetical protein
MAAGPILIFDKSALQGFSVDESVMLDTFFLTNMTPIFFIEALADLEKPDSKGRTPEQALMKDLAAKVPDQPHPNVFHRTLIQDDLLNSPVPMTGQIPLAGGVAKPDGLGGVSVVIQEPPEAEMVRRWQAAEFAEAERRYASAWREGLLAINFTKRIEAAGRLLPPGKSIRDLRGVKVLIDQFLRGNDQKTVVSGAQFLGLSDALVAMIDKRHAAAGRPPFDAFAPYAAFVLSVDLVFYLGMATGLIRSQRKTNLIDLSYLYYLPFCMVFTSKDRLHESLAPMFMRPRQRFVWADDLKAGLKSLNEYYAPLRNKMGRVGLMRVHEPPKEVPTIVSELWETCLRLDGVEREGEKPATSPPSDDGLLERINRIIASGETLPPPAGEHQPDSMILQGQMSLRRGSWNFYPERTEDEGRLEDKSRN